MDKQFHPTLYWVCDYLSMLESKSNQVNGATGLKPADDAITQPAKFYRWLIHSWMLFLVAIDGTTVWTVASPKWTYFQTRLHYLAYDYKP